jgi:hypothetical protein
MARPITPLLALIVLSLCRCASQPREHPVPETAPEEAPQTAPPAAEAPRLGRTFAVVSDPAHPAPDWLLESVSQTMAVGGGQSGAGLDVDLLIVCRSRFEDAMSFRPPDSEALTRATHLLAPDLLLRMPPDWTLRRPQTRWLAMVEISLQTWEADDHQESALREICVRLGPQGISGPQFDRTDLRALWQVLDAWVAGQTGAHGR